MSDDDLIRRGDAKAAAVANRDLGFKAAQLMVDAIKAIPAAQPTVKPLGADGVTIHPQDILNAAWRDDLGEEGLAMYARILSALDVQPTVSPDVVAPDEVYDTMMEVQRNPTGAWQAIHDQAGTITTLRAQLAEAHKDGSQLAAWQCLFDDGKTGIVCDDWGNQYCAMQRRAERAEAALAAPEVMHEDAPAAIIGEIGNQIHNLGCELQNDEDVSLRLSDLACRLWDAAKLFPTEPTALDRMLAEAREKALLEAVGVLRKWHDNLILCEFKEEPRTVGAAVDAILALIEKPNAR